MSNEEQKIGPFDYVNSINNKKQYMYDDGEGYNSYIVNRSLSYHPDAVLFVNDVNKSYDMPDQQKYDYLFYSVRKRNRNHAKWYKTDNRKTIANIMEYYECNAKVAKQYLRTMKSEDVDYINNMMAQRQ